MLDTLGWTVVRAGEAAKGIVFLRMATRLAPGQSEIRLHLAKALAETGDKEGARREVDEITKLDKASPVRSEAERLAATL